MHRRVDVAEVPFIRRQLAVGVQIGLPEHQVQLLLAEVRVHQRQCKDMKGQVPSRMPRIFPFVRHRDDVGVVHVVPMVVARGGTSVSLERVGPMVF
jgi:hypothetical protein